MKLSIIIPSLNEAESIVTTLLPLQSLRARHHEVILVDGGSSDDTVKKAQGLVDKTICSSKGRSIQMNSGAACAQGDVLWFLHSDTKIPENTDRLIEESLSKNKQWGRFDIRLSGQNQLFRLIERMMNYRSRITGIATGDQGIFVRQQSFNAIKGYQRIALMEDIDISRRLLKQYGYPACISDQLLTSSRRWEQHGIIKTVVLMWSLRLAYFLGVSPARLVKHYK